MEVRSATGIVTPEAVLLDFDTAGAGSRVLAEAIDIVIQLTGLSVVLMVLAGATVALPGGGWVAVVLMLVLSLGAIVGYPAAMETLWGGRTLGKAAFGLRVVTVEGGPIRFRHAMIRSVIGVLEIWMLMGLGALLAILFSRRNQRLGDMVAGTFVLRERTAVRSGAAFAFVVPQGYDAYVDTLDTSSLSDRQYQVLRSFLLRTDVLLPGSRHSLAQRLADPVALDMNHSRPPDVGPELFLACVVAAYQVRHGGPVPLSYGAVGPPGPIASGAAGPGWSLPPAVPSAMPVGTAAQHPPAGTGPPPGWGGPGSPPMPAPAQPAQPAQPPRQDAVPGWTPPPGSRPAVPPGSRPAAPPASGPPPDR